MVYKIEVKYVVPDGWFGVRYRWEVETENGKYSDGKQRWGYEEGGYAITLKGAKKRALKCVLKHSKHADKIGVVFAITGTPEQLKKELQQ